MRPDSLSTLLDYLQGLGQRHQDIVTSVVALPEQFTAPDAKAYPVMLVEQDPFGEGLPTVGANEFRVAWFVNLRRVRTDSKADVELVDQAIRLCDELLQQIQDESKLTGLQLKGANTYTLHYGTADEGLSSGARCEQAFVLPKAVNRHTNPGKFAPLVPNDELPQDLPAEL